jgi:hypothetical protein
LSSVLIEQIETGPIFDDWDDYEHKQERRTFYKSTVGKILLNFNNNFIYNNFKKLIIIK